MSRLVDVDELKHELKWLEEYDPPVYHDVVSTIDEMPSVDAVEVVRCRDCKWCEERQGRTGNVYNLCVYLNTWVDEDHFCSCGERREDEIG